MDNRNHEDAESLSTWSPRFALKSQTVVASCSSLDDAIVEPYRICPLCMRVVAEYTSESFWSVDGRGVEEMDMIAVDALRDLQDAGWTQNSKSVDFEGPDIDHYSGGTDLFRSADSGCHICSLLMPSRETPSESQLRIVPSKYFHNTRGQRRILPNQYQQIELSLEESSGRSQRALFLCRIPKPALQWAARMRKPLPASLPYSRTLLRYSNLLGVIPTGDGPYCDHRSSAYRWCVSTSATIGLSMTQSWIQRRSQHHHVCRQKLSSDKPARLLDIFAFRGSKDLRLVLFKHVQSDEYATLSYRWEANNPLTLKTMNLNSFKDRIQIERLSRSIQDAVIVCRRMGVKYLWVDALCIIQGPGPDLTREIAKMGGIYESCISTIAASDSTARNPGCFRPRRPLHFQEISFIDAHGTVWTFGIHSHNRCRYHVEDLEKCSLSKRGWVYQERAMSPRTIHFTANEIVFECRKKVLCHNCAQGLGDPSTSAEGFGPKAAVFSLHQDWERKGQEVRLRDLWRALAKRFDKTELTNADDRLSALSGLAHFIQSKSVLNASYGLWLDFLVDELQ